MGLLRIIIGATIGSLLSGGLAIGLIYGGIQVSWWLAIILGVVGLIIGGFVAGFISRDRLPGMIAGALTGVVAFVAIFLFFWLVLRVKVLNWYAENTDVADIVSGIQGFMGITPGTAIGDFIDALITDKFAEYSSDIDSFVQKYVPLFSLVIGGIFGSGALLLNTISGAIGGRLNKIDEIIGED
ncbi:MAG: hypothetical protein ACFFDW_15930 [Candidatus Thorarchaeota archaeon]